MVVLLLASSLFSAVTTFYNRRAIENGLMSVVNNPALQAWIGSWAADAISTYIRKEKTASHEPRENSPTWNQAILMTVSGLIVGVWIAWYLRGPQTPTIATPLQQPPQQIVLQNVIQVDRTMRTAKGRRSSSQPPRQRKKGRISGSDSMAALVLASSLLSAVTTFCNGRSIENALLSWVKNPAMQRWMGTWATEAVSTLVQKGQAALAEKESGPTWTHTILLAPSALMVGVWLGWYLRGPQTPTNSAPSQPQPQQIVVQNIMQVDRRMRAIRGRRSSSQPPRQRKKGRRSGRQVCPDCEFVLIDPIFLLLSIVRAHT
ncbi:uncharacterized protein [Dermacentor andersoni]|uniref:uncharacterized protein n=1 Tax=Dermacentor andersoni TaxID=34620 RepID=UPI003B3B3E76